MNEEEFLNWQTEEAIRIMGLSNGDVLNETLLAVGNIDHAYNEWDIWSCDRLIIELNLRLSDWLEEK